MPIRPAGKCLSVATSLRPLAPCKLTPITSHWSKLSPSTRALSTENSDWHEQRARTQEHPRWQATPPRMTAPVRSKPPVFNNHYRVNESQELLDKVFDNVLGRNGHRLLPEEVMWLCVTHKGFDHGRRGYNDRLAFFGRRIVNLHRSLAIVSRSPTIPTHPRDVYGRVPFQHPALDGVRNLLGIESKDSDEIEDPRFLGGKQEIAHLADRYGLLRVIRWKPKNARNLVSSGYELVISQALLAIVGAVALHKGGEVANTIVQERIIDPLRMAS